MKKIKILYKDRININDFSFLSKAPVWLDKVLLLILSLFKILIFFNMIFWH